MRRTLGILGGCGIAASALVAINVLPAEDAAASGLVSFNACTDMLEHLKREADDRVGPWGLNTGDFGYGVAEPMIVTDDAASAQENTDAGADASAERTAKLPYSTTNVQEADVGEPDIVKTDGQLIVTTLGSTLRVVDPTGDAPTEVGTLELGDRHSEASLLLSGERALVLLRGYPVRTMVDDEATADDREPMPAPGPHTATTTVLLVDLSDPANPAVAASLELDGSYLDARQVDGTVRLVVSSTPQLPFPTDELTRQLNEDELVERNREIVAESTAEDWLPSYHLEAGAQESSGQLVECDQLNRPADFAGFSTMSVLTLNFDDLTPGDAVGVLTDGDTVYASSEHLYVATANWAEPADAPLRGDGGDGAGIAPREPQTARTGIHAFDIRGDDPARYLASGEVEGQIIGRYAMSEHEGVLRVATTTHAHEAESSESQLVTLAEQGDELVQAGKVGGLGKGERIYAVRYFGDTGYVVTFRQVDPLYVLDLSDPAEPTVEGELKITGYSSYLHRVGPGQLVGLGQEATEEGRTVGNQVSLFDVSEPAEPRKLDGHVMKDAWSDAQADPHAFLYWPQTRQLVVPVASMGTEPRGEPAAPHSAALVLGVNDDTLTEQGLVTREGPGEDPGQAAGYRTSVLRSLVIGDSLYTLWHDGLQVNDLDDLEFTSWLPIDSQR